MQRNMYISSKKGTFFDNLLNKQDNFLVQYLHTHSDCAMTMENSNYFDVKKGHFEWKVTSVPILESHIELLLIYHLSAMDICEEKIFSGVN